MDVANLSPLEVGRRVVKMMASVFFHEPDHERDPAADFEQLPEHRRIQLQRGGGHLVLEKIAGQAELGHDEELGGTANRLLGYLFMQGEILFQVAKRGSDLRCSQTERAHGVLAGKRSATEQYLTTVPPATQSALVAKRSPEMSSPGLR